MEERKKLYKDFQGKKVRIITKSNFTYSTNNLAVHEDCLKFVDKIGQQVLLSFDEVKFITEVF